MTASSAQAPSTAVTVVYAPACHFCDDARRVLAEFATGYPLTVEQVGADTARGRQLLAEHRAGMFPLVLIDGVFFSSGRLPRGKLRKVLESTASAAVA